MNLPDWIARKHADIAAEQPLSLQTTIGALSQRLWAAEQALDQIGRLHRPDPTGSWCVHCGPDKPWLCDTARILADVGCPLVDPLSGAACQKIRDHLGQHGGIGRDGGWHAWH